MFPHDPAFPHRRRVLLIAVVAGSLVAVALPGLDLGRRIAAPCAIILSSAFTYAFVLCMLRLLSYLPRIIFVAYSYAFFYGGIVSAVIGPFFILAGLTDFAELSRFEEVLWLAGMVPLSLATSAGAYVAIDSERDAVQHAMHATRETRAPDGRH